MAGVVLENLSWKKLIALGVGLAIVLLIAFLVGGIIAPAPSSVMQIIGTKCVAKKSDDFSREWYIPNGEGQCDKIISLDPNNPEIISRQISANQIVFAFHIPYTRDNVKLRMSRWFQNLIGVLSIDIKNDVQNPHESGALMLRVKLGYQDHGDKNWTLYAQSDEDRDLECQADKDSPGYLICSVLSLFELGSISHDYYLINIKIPIDDQSEMNKGLGPIEDITLITIHQNGGFTKVWLSIKCVMFPGILIILVWYWRRVQLLSRQATLLEKMLFALGVTLTILNLPIEFISIVADAPYMTLLGDIRQGIFYAMLMAFWIIFTGEHIMDDSGTKGVVAYWKHLSAVAFGSMCLFIFDMCERGVKLKNPFFSIWVTTVGKNLALSFIVLAGISACCYFLFLSYMIFRVFYNIRAKKSSLPSMSSARRLYYMGLIYRFQFLMIVTLICAAATTIFFVISQVMDSQGHLNDGTNVQYTSAVFAGVYCMWNVYVFGLLSLYAPSHKNYPGDSDHPHYTSGGEEEQTLTHIPTISSETTHLSTSPTMEMADLTNLLTKSD